jgi:hypothetical protein
MVGSRFLLPPSQKMLNEDERSSSPNDDDPLAFFGVPATGQPGVPTAVPPWAMRYASARAAQDFGKSAAENSDQTGRKQQPVCRLVVKYSKRFIEYYGILI